MLSPNITRNGPTGSPDQILDPVGPFAVILGDGMS